MGHIAGLTPEQKSNGEVYCRQYKSEQSKLLLRNFVAFAIKGESAGNYYLIDGKVMSVDCVTSSKNAVSKKVFDFVGYGKHIGAEKENGKPDRRLLRFYKENPDKIPDFHKELFENLSRRKK